MRREACLACRRPNVLARSFEKLCTDDVGILSFVGKAAYLYA